MKKRSIITSLTSLVFTLILVFTFTVNVSAISEAEVSASPSLTLNQATTGVLNESVKELWYSFNITEPGYFRVSLSPNASANVDGINSGWRFSVYKKGDIVNSLTSVSNVISLTSTNWYAFAPDTFYVKVEHWIETQKGFRPDDVPFDLKVEFVKNDLWESEVNDESVSADMISTNTAYCGNLWYDLDADWYKYSVTKDGYQTFSLTPDADPNLCNPSNLKWGWSLTVYEADAMTEVCHFGKLDYAFTSPKYPMKKGEYFVKVTTEQRGDFFSPVGEVYNLKINETENKGWEAERNDEKKDANTIVLGTNYSGTTYKKEDSDWYQFEFAKAGVLDLSFARNEETNEDNIAMGWKFELYTKSGAAPIYSKENIIDSIRDYVELSAGTYYLRVKPHESYTWPENGIYDFSLNYVPYEKAILKRNMKISKAESGKKKATLKWDKVGYATGYEIYRSTKAKKGFKKVGSVNSKKTTFVNKKLKAGKTYYYKIRAFVKVKGKNYYSKYSAVSKVKIK